MQPLEVVVFMKKIPVLFPEGMIAIKERNLLFFIQALMLLVIVPVYILTFIFSWWYRADNEKSTYDPHLVDHKVAEVIWWGLPFVMLSIVAVVTWFKTYELDPYRPIPSEKKPLTIEAVALDWKWLFIYPEEKIATVNTLHSTLIGSLAGAIPPVVGYCAVRGRLDIAAGLLFLIMVLWQMPHFFAIGLWHHEDYAKAGIPILPVFGGAFRTKIHMILYIVCLISALALMTFMGLTGELFLWATAGIGLIWLGYGFKGFRTKNNAHWGKQMFRLSLLMISAFTLLCILDRVQ